MKILKEDSSLIFKIKNEFSDIRIINDIKPLINIVGDWKTYLFRFFRWSNNGLDYSEWIDISDNLDVFSDLCIYLRPKFFIDVKFTLKDVESNIGITDLKIDVEYNNIPKVHKPFSILYDALEEQTFKPVEQYTASNFYLNQNEAIDFWKKIMFQNQDIFGIPIKYIRANSVVESKDPFLMEWGLYHYQNPIDMKIILPEGEFASGEQNFTPFGIDYQIPFEIVIDKRYFERYFGVGTAPLKYDVIYFPDSDKIWQIEHQTLQRGFLDQPAYYRLNLTTYKKQSIIMDSSTMDEFDPEIKFDFDNSVETEELLKKITTGVEEIFTDDKLSEEKQVTNPLQTKIKNKYLDYRKCSIDSLSVNINDYIIDYELQCNGYPVLNQYYDFSNYCYEKSYTSKIIEYNITKDYDIQNETITFWNKYPAFEKNYKAITSITENEDNLIVGFSAIPKKVVVGSNLSIFNENNELVCIGIVSSISRVRGTVTITPNNNFNYYISNSELSNWKQTQNLKGSFGIIQNVISNFDTTGYEVRIFENHFIEVRMNTIFEYFKINKDKTDWNCFIIQLLGEFNQISFYQYSFSNNNLNKENQYIRDIAIPNFNSDVNYHINCSITNLSNIRIFTSAIKEEDHYRILLDNIVTDSNNALIIDNAEKFFNSPFIGQAK